MCPGLPAKGSWALVNMVHSRGIAKCPLAETGHPPSWGFTPRPQTEASPLLSAARPGSGEDSAATLEQPRGDFIAPRRRVRGRAWNRVQVVKPAATPS